MRIFKSGSVAARYIKTEPISWLSFGKSFHGKDFRSGRMVPRTYELKKSETSSLLKIWKQFSKFRKVNGFSKETNFFNIALKRFNFGIEESDYESKIIDFFIAFEALCLPESNELKYRLSNRVALLLAKDSEDAEKIGIFMKKAYDIRSSIVHGGRTKPVLIDGVSIDLKTFTPQLEEHLRRMLKAFLSLIIEFRNQQNIIAQIDKSLFDFKERRTLHSLLTL